MVSTESDRKSSRHPPSLCATVLELRRGCESGCKGLTKALRFCPVEGTGLWFLFLLSPGLLGGIWQMLFWLWPVSPAALVLPLPACAAGCWPHVPSQPWEWGPSLCWPCPSCSDPQYRQQLGEHGLRTGQGERRSAWRMGGKARTKLLFLANLGRPFNKTIFLY